MTFLKKNSLGILLCIAVAVASTFLAQVNIGGFSFEVIGAPVFSILIGMIITLIAPKLQPHPLFAGGIKFTSKKILQYAVIILGFSLNMSTIAVVGAKSLPIIVTTIATALIVAFILHKLMKVDSNTSTLIGVGSSICGGSAIAATAPVIDADDEEIARSISVIFLFNVAAALIFPTFGHAIGMGSEGFAIFAGTAINDTSSVTAAASTAEGIYGCSSILTTAVTVKLTRTLAIIPITLALAFWRIRKAKKNGGQGKMVSIKKIFPWFILFFLGAALLTTLIGLIPENGFTLFYNNQFVGFTKWLAKFFIAMALCGIGLNTNIIKLVKNGVKPIIMGLICWVSITGVSIGMQLLTNTFFTNL